MILVTGGLGFIGLHTARALLDQGEDVVLTQYRVAREPDFLKEEMGKRAFVEQLDVTDDARLMDIGKKHKITGIVHLAVPGLNALGPADDFKVNMNGLINILEAGRIWEVKRVSLASSLAVYTGVREGPWGEDLPLAPIGRSPTEAYKKSFEILGGHYASRTGLDVVMLRIAQIYGPLYHSMGNLPSRLVHAAVKGTAPEMRGETYMEDTGDLTYVKDAGRGIAMVHTAESLPAKVYNIGSGRATKNAEIVSSIRAIIPDAQAPLKEGAGPTFRQNAYCDISRAKKDVGYEPQFQMETAVPDYINWLRAGNPT